MPKNFDIGAEEAVGPVPQGQRPVADPVPCLRAKETSPALDAAANNPMPQGQPLTAAASDPIAVEADADVPQGQTWIASAAIPLAVGAAIVSVPQGQSPSASPAANQSDAKASGLLPQGHRRRASASEPIVEGEAGLIVPQGHCPVASALNDLCGELMKLQRDRIFAIRMQSRCDRAVEAYIRTRLGFTTDPTRMGDVERKRLSTLAKRIKLSVEQGADQAGGADEAIEPVVRACSPIILRNVVGRMPWDTMRAETEREMRSLARQLPVWPFVQGVPGVSDLSLAVIVGEAGNLGEYPKKGHLWKRLGLAVIDGKRQGNPGTGATAADWIRHGYKATRRAEVFAFLDDVMLRAQWRGDRDAEGKNPVKTKQPVAVPAHPIGPYGAHYGRKKAEYLERWADEPHCKAHAEKAARRYASKMFVRDLWVAWRGGQETGAERSSPLFPDAMQPALAAE